MTDETPSLDVLRREIDEIDIAVHDLLMRRTSLADRIGNAKGEGTAFIRPGREAQILRRLIARHRGPFPQVVVVRIWREIISALAALQGPFAVAVYVPADAGEGLRALARAHYGSERPISVFDSVGGVLRAVSDGQATIGVLPLPGGEEPDLWWRGLTREGANVPRIVARLPFASQSRRFDGQEGLAVALAPPEPSGKDRSLVAVENAGQVSRSGLKDTFAEFDLTVVDLRNGPVEDGSALVLVEVDGFLAPDDPRLARLKDEKAALMRQVWIIGAYAVPLSAEELAGAETATEAGSEAEE